MGWRRRSLIKTIIFDELELVKLGGKDNNKLGTNSNLDKGIKENIVCFLKKRMDVFEWKPEDMTRISPKVITYKLNVNPYKKLVQWRKRKFPREKNQVIWAKVRLLKEVGIVIEVDYPTWLWNVVLVNKVCKALWMCITFTHVNNACPKDFYLLPSIDKLVDTTIG